ncbi:MAG: ABC transporter permease [Stackebrandtia sp.]
MSMPNALTLGTLRGEIELKQFFRERDSLVFTFSLPAILLLLLGSIFPGELPGGVTVSQLYVASILAGGIASTSFVNLGIGVATDRDDGTLKRLRGMPMSPLAYFLGKVILVMVASLAELALLLTMGVVVFDLELPTQPEKWLTLAWLFVLGVTGCALLGIAAANMAGTARSAGSVTMLPLVVLQFISGVYIMPPEQIGSPFAEIGAVFPVKWLAQGLRSVFLPDGAKAFEASGSWDLGLVALVLGIWCVAGLVLCLMTFRWRSRLTR